MAATGTVLTIFPTTIPAMMPPTTTQLVTIFTPPASCSTDIIYGLYYNFSRTADWDLSVAPLQVASCYPTQYTAGVTFSPGVCPYNYNWGSLLINSIQSETIATCCPPNYSIKNGDISCSSGINDPVSSDGRLWARQATTTISVYPIAYPLDPSNQNTTLLTESPQVITLTKQTWVYAPTLEVRWRASDTEVLSLIPRQASLTKSNQLSPPKIAGLVIGLIVAMLSLSACIVIWRFRRRRSREDKIKGDEWQKPELESKEISLKALNELSALKVDNAPIELPVTPIPPVELPSDSQPEKFRVQIDSKE